MVCTSTCFFSSLIFLPTECYSFHFSLSAFEVIRYSKLHLFLPKAQKLEAMPALKFVTLGLLRDKSVGKRLLNSKYISTNICVVVAFWSSYFAHRSFLNYVGVDSEPGARDFQISSQRFHHQDSSISYS